jgi:putative ABC transport system permease protein
MLANLLQDARYALHGFASRPMFAGVVVLTLAVGIGVNVAVFSLFDRIILRELNVANPRELVNLTAPQGNAPGNRSCNQQGRCDQTFSYGMFRDLEAAGDELVDLAASRIIVANFGRDGSTDMGSAVLVSGSYFSALGVGPELGRVLGEQDVGAEPAASAVLSYDYWQTAYAAAPDVLGKTLVVAGKPLTIVGVAPRGFVGATPSERPRVFAPLTLAWFPERLRVPLVEDRFWYYTYVFGRLRDGVSLERAQVALNATYRAIHSEVEAPLAVARAAELGYEGFDIEEFRRAELTLEPGSRGQTQAPVRSRTPLAVFFAATATILLIGCVNLANLMLARAATRVGEIAVRASLGAARRRLVGLLSVEALLLAGIAALVSLPIAFGVLRAIDVLQPPDLSASGVDVDLRAAAAAFGIAALSTLLFALLPTLRLVATDPVRALQGTSARAFGGKNLGRFRFALATSQIALSMLLLVLAALFTQSLANIARVDLGLRTESVVTFEVAPSLAGYSQERQAQTFEAIERELEAEPGVTHAAYSRVGVLSGAEWGTGVWAEGHEDAGNRNRGINANLVSPGFFDTLEIPLLRGRLFTDADSAGRPLVAVVNESFAKRFGLGDDPVGMRLGRERRGEFEYEIVGLVRDAAYGSVKEQFPAQIFLARRQEARLGDAHTFYVRGDLPPEAILAAVPRVVARVDANLPVMEARTLDSVVTRNLRMDWLLVTLSGTLAVVATLLAALGLYGVLSYMVAQRTREIGLRLALGAEPAGVRRMVLKQVGWMAGIGVPIGIVAAVMVGNWAASMLFGLAPTDPRAVVAAAILLAAAVFGASYWPARKASRVDPVVAMRAE